MTLLPWKNTLIKWPADMLTCPLCNGSNNRASCVCKDMVVFRCAACGMMYQDAKKIPTESWQSAETMYREYFSMVKPQMLLNKGRLGRIKKFLKFPLRALNVLEIGVGSGSLASLMVEEGVSYHGLEPVSACYIDLLTRFPELKGRVSNKFYEEGYFKDNYFDLLIMTDTLEHIPGPVSFLNKIRKCLKDDAILYIEVPNESLIRFKGWIRRKFKMYCGYPTHPQHISLFTMPTLGKTLEAAGFKTEALFQATVWGDKQRISIALNKDNLSWWLKGACFFFRHSRIDVMLQQGVIVSVSRKLP